MSDWRSIDIYALEPENFLTKQDLIPDLPPVSHDVIVGISQQCRQALSSGQFIVALTTALDTPPYVADEATKSLHAETVFEVLCSIRNNHSVNDLSKFVTQLDSTQQDTLVKYLYKSMGTGYGTKQGGLLLSWFEKTVEITGLGPIVRYMTDRRTV
ncbi:actin-related protein 2/3 complex subunit 5 [[Candida] railenensis]|uniref:Actin-related protein 2/3 complex subunit 5 n=1 Tax=[Candida] railenensis TaxID=45579 RepID=A0A9P0VX98_9ASCO|nr:actin-related protein 2/3 complex subunit 5 [[Candida] railenensis]